MAGHPRNFETPEDLWKEFCAYAESVKAKPRYKTHFVGKDGNEVKEPLERPLTIEGFKNWCYDRVGTVHQYLNNQDGLFEQYLPIVTRVKEAIRQDQIEGGMVGQYNHTITARLNGLIEKTETKNTHEVEIFKGIDLDVQTDNSPE
jgi:hypothetical protein